MSEVIALEMVEQVYSSFLEEVIVKQVLNDRLGQLGDKTAIKIAKGSNIDPRMIRLMSKSGKGGWSDYIEDQEKFLVFYNVTLLDHLLSVVRGAITLAALDWLSQNPNMQQSILKRKLYAIAAIAFLHDADKDLGLPRNTELTIADIESLMEKYKINDFLQVVELSFSGEQVLYLIEKIEVTQAHRHLPKTLPSREIEALCPYIRYADKLDGVFLNSKEGGLQGVIKRLQSDASILQQSHFLKQWRSVEIFDPHHPFLLDELQRWLSIASRKITGIPPLIEQHQDGTLYMLLPESHFDAIVERGLCYLTAHLPFNLELNISNRGIPALFNGRPSYDELENFIDQLLFNELIRLFLIKSNLMETVTDLLTELLAPLGLEPRWSKGGTQLVSIYAEFNNLEPEAKEALKKAALLVLLLNLKVEAPSKSNIPDYNQREEQLLEILNQEGFSRIEWINDIEDDASRRVITALWILALEEVVLASKIWGEQGILKIWLEGSEEIPGFNRYVTGKGAEIVQAVEKRFKNLLLKQYITSDYETEKGRCLFTDEPMLFQETIEEALGLYEVKVSAFSGRENRLESVTSDRSHTNVSAVSIAEHKLRSQAYSLQGGIKNGVPSLVSISTTAGLFAGLILTTEQSLPALSIYDLNRFEIKKDKVIFQGIEMYRGRYRMARLERISNKLEDQINQLRLFLKAAQRIGRPIHIFKGLPTSRKEFFYFDAMPKVLLALIGSKGLRLEQIPKALDQLIIAQTLIETNGLGYDILRLYADIKTRFAAICLVWCEITDRLETAKPEEMERFKTLKINFYQAYKQGNSMMSDQDTALVALGKKAAQAQRYVSANGSISEQLLIFDICLETAEKTKLLQEDFIYAITGELEHNLLRKDKAIHKDGEKRIVHCKEIAKWFVEEVWIKTLKNHSPAQSQKRILQSIYRIAFLDAQKQRIAESKKEEQ